MEIAPVDAERTNEGPDKNQWSGPQESAAWLREMQNRVPESYRWDFVDGLDEAAEVIESLQAEVEKLRARLTYEKAQRIALTERLQELDPPEEVHGT